MKIHKISPFYSGIYVFVFISMLIMEAAAVGFAYMSYRNHGFSIALIECVAFVWIPGGMCQIISVHSLTKGMAADKYSVDAEGMTVYTRKQTYRLLWSECTDFDIVFQTVNWDQHIAIVYCTKKPATAYERTHFLKCRQNQYDETMFFQYSDRLALEEYLNCIPSPWKERLSATARRNELI